MIRTALLALISVLLHAPLAAADEGYAPYSPDAAAEQVSAPLFVVIAYSLIWLVLVGFVASVWRRQRRVERELDSLRRELEGSG